MTETIHEQGVITPGAVASGALQSNRINPCETVAGETTNVRIAGESGTAPMAPVSGSPRRRTTRGNRSRKGRRKTTSRVRRHAQPGVIWQHTPRGTFEAAKILDAEGYIVGKTTGPDPVFDLVGRSPEQAILVKVVRPRQPVHGAARVAELYLNEIRRLQPYCRTADDRIEIWTFSREIGLARYRVFGWGIGNAGTIAKLLKTRQESALDPQKNQELSANQPNRNSPCPDGVSG